MRYTIKKRNSTKAERVVYEVLKELHINFKHRWLINGREVDFLIGNRTIEINGHNQDPLKNKMLIESGYSPVHLPNNITKNREAIRNIIKKL